MPSLLVDTHRPRLSIVVPVLNEANSIRACLQALAPLRTRGTEVIVVDGGSRDGTVRQCDGLADQVMVSAAGRARQMNAGATRSQGSVLLFLHADTRLPVDADELVLAALRDKAAAWGRFDVHIEGTSRWLPAVALMMNLRSRLSGIATGDQSIFVRREVFEQLGGFPDQPLMEDIELCKRLRRLPAAGRPCCLRQRVTTSGRRWDQRGALRTIGLMWRLRLLYWMGVSSEQLARAYR